MSLACKVTMVMAMESDGSCEGSLRYIAMCRGVVQYVTVSFVWDLTLVQHASYLGDRIDSVSLK